MSRDDRFQVFPTRGTLVMLKSRSAATTKGYGLLKRKADALQLHFRVILQKLINAKIAMSEAVREAEFSLAEVRFVTGDMVNPIILETVDKARTKIYSWNENMAGINVILFQSYQEGVDTYEYAGLSRGGQQLATVKQKFIELIKLIVELASLQSSYVTIDRALKTINVRVSAIKHIILPKLENTVCYVISELDELDREQFYRIKKLKVKKIENKVTEIIDKNKKFNKNDEKKKEESRADEKRLKSTQLIRKCTCYQRTIKHVLS